MKITCPQCGKLTHGTKTVAENYLEVKRCYNQREVIKAGKKVMEACRYSGFVPHPYKGGKNVKEE